MKIFLTVLYVLLILIGLTIAGLLIWYHVKYQPPPPLPDDVEYTFGATSASEEPDIPFALIPVPQQMEFSEESFIVPEAIHFQSPDDQRELIEKLIEQQLEFPVSRSGPVSFQFSPDDDLKPQGYSLEIRSQAVNIRYADEAGLFYSLVTLKQLLQQSDGSLPGLTVTDWPDLPVRGAMLDISRDKIPTMETLYEIVDFLAGLKYNHLQLYVEGFSLDYPSFRHVWDESETPINGEEIQALDRYAKERFIDLVPNQNSLGHMNAWLETEEFADLAECPDGFKLLGLIDYKSTLDVSDPRSMELVKQMTDDMLPNFSSEYFNANLDEPFELGQCKNRELAEEKGAGQLYINFVKELEDFVAENHERQMMMWGDIVTKHPEIIPQIPDEVILLEWGYEDVHPFKDQTRKYREAGLDFMVCPGTSSWTTITGRTDNMKQNISNAVHSAIQNDARGMLLTDWGDMGHWQYWPVSIAPFVYGSALSWNVESEDRLPFAAFLNRMAFQDSSGVMGDLVLDMGRYNQFEEYKMVNMTTTMQTFMFGIMDKGMIEAVQNKLQDGLFELIHYDDEIVEEIKQRFENAGPYDYRSIIEYTSILEERLDETQMERTDAALILDEYRNAVRMIHLGALTKKYIQYKREHSATDNIELLQQLKQLNETVIEEHQRLWLTRNRSGGLDRSLQMLKNLDDQINRELTLMNRNTVSRFLILQGEKLVAAAASVYLKFQ